MRYYLLLILLITTTYSSTIFGLESVHSSINDPRVKWVTYQENNIVPIYGTTFITTEIVFSSEETIISIQNGDQDAWYTYYPASEPYVLFIKPTLVDSKPTNLLVVTNKHLYNFILYRQDIRNVAQSAQEYVVKFTYPEEEKAKIAQQLELQQAYRNDENFKNATQNPKSYNWDYSSNGDQRIVPIHVFDDGHFTYFELQPNQPIPAIFAVNNKNGNESLVNFRRDGNFLVIQQIAPQFTLRDGKLMVATLFNNCLINKLKNEGVS